MQFALMMGIEMGAHELPFHLDNPLGIVFWIALLLGAGVQTILSRKVTCRLLRAVWMLFLLLCMLVCEIACQVITGWDLLLPVLLYFYLLTMLAGALLCVLFCRLRQRKET